MHNVQEIANLLNKIEKQLNTCTRCGMCQSVCPLYKETGMEADVARGKLALLDALLNNKLKEARGAYERLDKCLLCGSCAANCPSGVKALDIFIYARTAIAGYLGLSPANKLILRGLLAHPAILDRLLAIGSKVQDVFTRPVNAVLGTSCARIDFGHLRGGENKRQVARHIVKLAQKPLNQIHPSLTIPAKAGKPSVLFYPGCLIDKFYPNVAIASINTLVHHGFGVTIPENLGCCGIPAISGGDLVTFNKLMRHNLEKMTAGSWKYIVTACATCTSTIKQVWPQMATMKTLKEIGMTRTELLKWCLNVMDISELIVDKGREIDRSMKFSSTISKVTYHDPCHLKKSLGVYVQPRQLILADQRHQLIEMVEPDRCCGMGGAFNLHYYGISSSIGRKKREAIVATGASTVATGCPACMMQISDQLSKNRDQIDVKHFIEVYAEALAPIQK